MMVKQIVIVGGGAAGWLVAGVLAAEHRAAAPDGVQVTLVESPETAPIGVGEGTWPTMRDTLRRIGVSETDFLRECDAAFKQGSRFDGWVDGSAADYYFHPFVLPQGYGEANLAAAWQRSGAAAPFADVASFQPHLCAQGRAPKQATTPEYAAVANYGYHLDAGKFGSFLRRHCVEVLGVRHVVDHVTGVDAAANGDIAGVRTREHGSVTGDLFVDCTGMRALLLGGHYGVPVRSQRHVLFNDTALAVQVPYPGADTPIASQTTSAAQHSGWIWDIGLPSRRGIGHVYSSAHSTDDAAERVLRAWAGSDIAQPRKIRFEPGYREKFWHRNCVAIGLSAGFIEPLEASALALVELSAAMLADDLPPTRAAMELAARRFNDAFTYRWERVIEFLKLHYVLSRRGGAFWEDNRHPGSIPDRLRELLELWRHRAPSRHDFPRAEEVFPSASYQYVLYGMGPGGAQVPAARQSDRLDAALGYFRETADLTRRMLAALPANRDLLNHIQKHRLPRI